MLIAKKNDHKHHYFILLLLMIICLLLSYLYYLHHLDILGKTAPLIPEVKEQMAQARTLQKQGKLTESVTIFEQFAMQGHPEAMFYLAKAYSKGWGVMPNLDKARWLLLNAVEFNFPYRGETAYQLGRLFQQSSGPNCHEIAVQWFKKALSWRYIKASVALGSHYEKGLGVQQDFDKAISYYQQASQQGIAIAALKHARIISTGKFGVPIDLIYAEQLILFAVKSLKKEALNGKASAAKILGRLYRDGIVTTNAIHRNTEKAIYWLRISSELGNTGAKHDLAHLLLLIDENKYNKEALTLLKESAKQGHGGAATSLGRMHNEKKYSLEQDQAVSWFQKGVQAGHSGAMQELAVLFYQGVLVNKDINQAIKLLQKGANQGHSASKRLLNKYKKERRKLNSQNKNKQTSLVRINFAIKKGNQ